MSESISTTGSLTPDAETAAETEQRFRREADMIREARASVVAGRVSSLEAATAWVDSWDTENELPPPHLSR
jgi:predicted transcriptional regulator